MIVLITLVTLFVLWIVYKFYIAKKLLLAWLEEKNWKLISSEYHFAYKVTETFYSPFRQILYEIEIEDNNKKRFKGFIIIGNWFWGFLKDEIHFYEF